MTELGIGIAFPGVKDLGYDADHSPPSRAEVKKAWMYAAILPYFCMAWCLIKHKENLLYFKNIM
jgi:hypothetical protein